MKSFSGKKSIFAEDYKKAKVCIINNNVLQRNISRLLLKFDFVASLKLNVQVWGWVKSFTDCFQLRKILERRNIYDDNWEWKYKTSWKFYCFVFPSFWICLWDAIIYCSIYDTDWCLWLRSNKRRLFFQIASSSSAQIMLQPMSSRLQAFSRTWKVHSITLTTANKLILLISLDFISSFIPKRILLLLAKNMQWIAQRFKYILLRKTVWLLMSLRREYIHKYFDHKF